MSIFSIFRRSNKNKPIKFPWASGGYVSIFKEESHVFTRDDKRKLDKIIKDVSEIRKILLDHEFKIIKMSKNTTF